MTSPGQRQTRTKVVGYSLHRVNRVRLDREQRRDHPDPTETRLGEAVSKALRAFPPGRAPVTRQLGSGPNRPCNVAECLPKRARGVEPGLLVGAQAGARCSKTLKGRRGIQGRPKHTVHAPHQNEISLPFGGGVEETAPSPTSLQVGRTRRVDVLSDRSPPHLDPGELSQRQELSLGVLIAVKRGNACVERLPHPNHTALRRPWASPTPVS